MPDFDPTAFGAPLGGENVYRTPAPAAPPAPDWRAYANVGGTSSVRAYAVADDRITVRFSDGTVYVYSYSSAGKANVERAKRLAYAGIGLNSWIVRGMRKSYESKG